MNTELTETLSRDDYETGHADGWLDASEGLSPSYFTGNAGATPVVWRHKPWREKTPVVCAPEELEYAHGYIDGFAKEGEGR